MSTPGSGDKRQLSLGSLVCEMGIKRLPSGLCEDHGKGAAVPGRGLASELT